MGFSNWIEKNWSIVKLCNPTAAIIACGTTGQCYLYSDYQYSYKFYIDRVLIIHIFTAQAKPTHQRVVLMWELQTEREHVCCSESHFITPHRGDYKCITSTRMFNELVVNIIWMDLCTVGTFMLWTLMALTREPGF